MLTVLPGLCLILFNFDLARTTLILSCVLLLLLNHLVGLLAHYKLLYVPAVSFTESMPNIYIYIFYVFLRASVIQMCVS